jgi:transcriptional regulator with XRE-family HTH domain
MDFMTSPETIGQRIKRERLTENMTQRELADRVKVGVPHISKIEAGRENPSDELLARIAGVFRLETEELLLVARRLPEGVVESLASDPAKALAFLRTFDPNRENPKG